MENHHTGFKCLLNSLDTYKYNDKNIQSEFYNEAVKKNVLSESLSQFHSTNIHI